MTPLNLAHNTLDKLKGIKMPTVNCARLMKFFNEAFLDLHEEELAAFQKPKVKNKE